jgi:hypothetical protein
MSAPVAALVARVEAAGALLRLGADGEVEMIGPAPPPELVAELRASWADVLDLLLLRKVLDVAPPPGWLEHTARAIRDALEAGAEPETDRDGWLYLAAPDGGPRVAVAPDTLAQIAEAGLLRPVRAEGSTP